MQPVKTKHVLCRLIDVYRHVHHVHIHVIMVNNQVFSMAEMSNINVCMVVTTQRHHVPVFVFLVFMLGRSLACSEQRPNQALTETPRGN